MWNGNGTTRFLLIREGMIHGAPLSMVAYVKGIPLLTKKPKTEFPDVTHPWYADNAGALSIFCKSQGIFEFI